MNILVIRMSSIGDIILTTPVLRAIRRQFPQAMVDFLVMTQFAEAISGNRNIDHLLRFDKHRYAGIGGILAYARQLKRRRYDLVIDLHAKARSRLLCWHLAARVIRYKKRCWWKTLGVRLRWIRYHVDDTIVRNYFQPLKVWGIHYQGETLEFDYSADDARTAAAFKGTIVFAPGAANNTKKWPREYFGDLGRLLAGTIVLVGGARDHADLELIRRRIGDRCTNLAGQLSLKQSGALIAGARFIVTNDSGPFHMARAVGTRAYVIFGPTDPGMFDLGPNTVLVYREVPCAPCSLHGDRRCPQGHFDCMRQLTPSLLAAIITRDGASGPRQCAAPRQVHPCAAKDEGHLRLCNGF